MRLRFLLSGGGTAGHVYPALTVAEELRADGRDEVVFVGTARGLEASLVPQAELPFVALPSKGFNRSKPLTLFTAAWTAVASMFRGLAMIRRMRPDAVVGFGGYVSLPIGLSAVLARVPLVLAEQNSVPGLANRVLSRWARAVGVTYPDSASFLPHARSVRVTGNPVRPAVLTATRHSGRLELGLPDDALVMLVFGGSRGARHLNEATLNLYPSLMEVEGLHIIHVVGAAELETARGLLERQAGVDHPRYRLYNYLYDMGGAIAASDLVVARAGATSIAEITALGKPCVLVPYPYATDDHQTLNARSVVAAGAAVLVPDVDLDSARYRDELLGLLRDGDARAKMAGASARLGRRDAASAVAEMIRESARNEHH